MIVLDTPRKWRALLNGVWTRAQHHGKEALPILGAVATALLRHADMATWPSATSAKTSAAPGAQLRFMHGRHYLKLRWDHGTRTIVLAEVRGTSEGRTLEVFREADDAATVDRKMATTLANLGRAVA
jgi:hypothetical protein